MFRYILLNKPYNVLCQFSLTGESVGLTLKDYLPIKDVYPVGRLDKDSEGLLLLTNNGPLQNRLANPRFAHPRTYWVQVEGQTDQQCLQSLRNGLDLKNYRTRPVEVKQLTAEPDLPPRDPPIRYRKNIPTSWLEMTLTEGKNRQVRHMTAKVGFPTLRLIRISITLIKKPPNIFKLTLLGLEPGEWRYLTLEESGVLESL